jgi:hypothetical protein
MKKQKQKIAKTSYDRAHLFRQAFNVPTYEEGGEAGERGVRDQVAGPKPKQKNRFLKGLADIGKFGLNQLTTPFETVTGWEFYDPSFSDTKFGSTVGKVSNVAEGLTSAATDIAGTAFLGPGYMAGKAALTAGFDMAGAQDVSSGQVFARGGSAGRVRQYANGGPPSFLEAEKFQQGWAAPKPQGPYDPFNPPWGFLAHQGAGVRPTGGIQNTFPVGPSSSPSDAPKQRPSGTQGGMGGINQQQLIEQDTQNTLNRLYHSNPGNTMEPASIAPLAPMEGDDSFITSNFMAQQAQQLDNPNPDISTPDMPHRERDAQGSLVQRPTTMSKEEEDAMMLSDPSYRRDESGKITGTAGKMYNAPDEPVLPTKGRLDRWKEHAESKNQEGDFLSAFLGTDRTAHSMGNTKQWAGIAPFIQGFKEPTLAETKQEEEYQKNVREGKRKMDVYGQEGTTAGITGDEDPRPKDVHYKPNKKDTFGRIGTSLAQLGDLAAKSYSGYAGGAGPEWSKILGQGEIPLLSEIRGGKQTAEMGGNIGQFYGGVNAAFLANRDDKKHLGYGYNSGGQPPKKYEPGSTVTRAQVQKERIDSPGVNNPNLNLDDILKAGDGNWFGENRTNDPGGIPPGGTNWWDANKLWDPSIYNTDTPGVNLDPKIKKYLEDMFGDKFGSGKSPYDPITDPAHPDYQHPKADSIYNAYLDSLRNSPDFRPDLPTKEARGGHINSYKTGGVVNNKDTVNLEELPGDVLKVPNNFDGAFELTQGNLHDQINPQTGKTGIHIITPGEGQEVEIEAQRGEMLDVDKDTQETFVIPRKFTPEYKKIKKEQGRLENKLEKHAEKKAEGKPKLDDIEVESLEKKLNNSYIRQDAIRQQILEEKEAADAADAQVQAQLGQGGQQPIMGSEAPVENFAEGARVSAPFVMGMANYGRGIRNTKDWYDKVSPGGIFEPINPMEGVMDESVNYLKDEVSQIDAAEANAAAQEAMNINKYNATVQNKVNSAGIEDARMRANASVKRRDAAARRDTFGKQRLNIKGLLAKMMGKGNQLEAMGADKMRQNEQMLAGDFHGALAKDFDEIYNIMGSESKHQAQNAINKRLQEQLESMKEEGDVDPALIPGVGGTGTKSPVNAVTPPVQTAAQIKAARDQATIDYINTYHQSPSQAQLDKFIADKKAGLLSGGNHPVTGLPYGTIPVYSSYSAVPKLNTSLEPDDPNIVQKMIFLDEDGVKTPMEWDADEGMWRGAEHEKFTPTAPIQDLTNEDDSLEVMEQKHEAAAIKREEELKKLKQEYFDRTGEVFTMESLKPLDSWVEGREYEFDWEKDQSSVGGYYMKDGKYYDELNEEITKDNYDNRIYRELDDDGNEKFFDKNLQAVTEKEYYDYLDKYEMYDDTETDDERDLRYETEIQELEYQNDEIQRKQILEDWEDKSQEVGVEETVTTTPVAPSATVVAEGPKTFEDAYDMAVAAGVDFPHVVAAQFGLETGWGKKKSGTTYGLFNMKYNKAAADRIEKEAGIKVHKGKTAVKDSQTGSVDYYMDFDSYEDAFKAYAAFIKTNKRYKRHGAFKSKTNREYIAALKKAGYAEDDDYIEKIMKIVSSGKGKLAKREADLIADATKTP